MNDFGITINWRRRWLDIIIRDINYGIDKSWECTCPGNSLMVTKSGHIGAALDDTNCDVLIISCDMVRVDYIWLPCHKTQ